MIVTPNESKNGKATDYWVTPSNEEFLSVVTSPVLLDVDRSSLDSKRKEWFGNMDLEKAVSAFQRGWPEGADNVRSISARISSPLFQKAEKTIAYDVAPGSWIDTDRFLHGEPEVWGDIVDSDIVTNSARGKFVHVMVNASMCCSACGSQNCMTNPVDPKILINRGAAICSTIDVLEVLGFRTKVSLVCSCRFIAPRVGWINPEDPDAFHRFSMLLPVKDYHDAVDMDALSFKMCHPAMSRRLIFAYMEHLPQPLIDGLRVMCGRSGQISGTYGRVIDKWPDAMTPPDDGEAVMYFPTMSGSESQFASDASSTMYVRQLLQKQGITFQDDRERELVEQEENRLRGST